MRIEKLTLHGVLRFRDTLELDLTEVPAGLVALVGPNGSGKTTLLEAAPAALYRTFMSRGDLADYATESDSFIELQLAIDGRGRYKARVSIDGPKRSSNATLDAIQPNGSCRSLNDGKVTTYDQVVAREFPSKELLLASSFAAQNKTGSFISLDKKNRKTLFMQLLGIERYQGMSETARQAAALVEQARGRLNAQRELLARDTADAHLVEIDRLAQELQVSGGRAELRQLDLQTSIADVEARLAMMADAVAAHAAATQRLATLRTEHASRQAELSRLADDAQLLRAELLSDQKRLTARRDAELSALEQELQRSASALVADIGAADATRTEELEAIARKLAGNQQILDMADRIRASVAEAGEVALEQQRVRDEADGHLAEIERHRKAVSRLDTALVALAVPTQQLARAQADASLLGSVPCGGSGAFAPCQFLANAKAAEARIPELAATVATRESLEAERQPHLDAMRAAEVSLDAARRRLDMLADIASTLQGTTKYAEPLAAAEARIAELTERRAGVEVTHTVAVGAAEERCAARTADILARRQRVVEHAAESLRDVQVRCDASLDILRDREASLTATVARLDAERQQAEHDLGATTKQHQAAADLQHELRQLRLDWDDTVAALARVESGREELHRRRDAIVAKRAELAEIAARIERLDTELLDWQLLTKAFGRDGLPVLEIDAAGPTISAYTNELLEVCFGPRFSVELVTQQLKADGKGLKDDFSIRVFDNQRGGESRDIADLSGGEQVIVAEALSNAICIYVNTRSPMPVRTCWRDETTGALDPENATRYLAMLRKVQQLGGFHHVLFISHNPEAAAQADAQIQLHDGTATIAFPPYVRQEAA